MAKSAVEKMLQAGKTKSEKPRPHGVYLTKVMRADLEKIADNETGGNLHAVLQYGLKYFIKQYKAGKIKIEKETQTKLKI